MERAFIDLGRSLRWWSARLLPLMLANLLWIVFSLTGIFFPAATLALFLVTNRFAYDQPVRRSLFTRGMRLYGRIALRWFAAYGLGLALFIGLFATGGEITRGIALVTGLWWALLNLLVLALIVEQPRKRVRDAFRNVLVVAALDPLYTLVHWIAITLIVIGMLHVRVLPLLPFAPSLIALIATRAVLTQTQASGLPPDPDRAVTL